MWYWHNNRCTDQWNKTGAPVIDLHINGQLIVNKDIKATH